MLVLVAPKRDVQKVTFVPWTRLPAYRIAAALHVVERTPANIFMTLVNVQVSLYRYWSVEIQYNHILHIATLILSVKILWFAKRSSFCFFRKSITSSASRSLLTLHKGALGWIILRDWRLWRFSSTTWTSLHAAHNVEVSDADICWQLFERTVENIFWPTCTYKKSLTNLNMRNND